MISRDDGFPGTGTSPSRGMTDFPEQKFLDPAVSCNISPTDIDHLVSDLNHRIIRGRQMLT